MIEMTMLWAVAASVCKLAGLLDISWFWVFAPFGFTCLIIFLIYTYYYFIVLNPSKSKPREKSKKVKL